MIRAAALAAVLCLCASEPAGAEVIARSGNERTVLLEVFSSEGCGSSPVAEAWVTSLAQNRDLWKRFVPAVFHVDSWDFLGWRDVFAKESYAQRQRAYAATWEYGDIYTPAFVLNGQEWPDWKPGEAPQPEMPQPSTGTLTIERLAKDQYRVNYQLMPDGAAGPDVNATKRLHLVLMGSGIVSKPKHGENANRRLVHDFTVLDYLSIEVSSSRGLYSARLDMMRPPDILPDRWSVAAWVSKAKDPTPLQAAGAYLLS